MIRVEIRVKDIDYNSLIELMMPYIEKGLSDKNNFFTDIFSKIISKNGKPTKFSSFLVSVLPNKDDMVASLFPHFDDILIEYINEQLINQRIAAQVMKVKSDTVTKNEDKILRFRIEIDEIDYKETVEQLLPTMLQRLSAEQNASSKIAKILLTWKNLPVEIIKGAIDAIPPCMRDDFVASVLNEYRVELKELLNSMIERNQVTARVSKITIKGNPEGSTNL